MGVMLAGKERYHAPCFQIVHVRHTGNFGHGYGKALANSVYWVAGKGEVSWNEFKLHNSREHYSSSANRRFSLLDNDYFAKKATEDKFPLVGNVKLAKAIATTLEKEPGREYVFLDIGAAGGALSTLCLLQKMFDNGITNVKVILNDISTDALNATKEWNFVLPVDLLRKKYGWSERFVDFARKIISNAEIAAGNILEIGMLLPKADVVYSGFTHHHMNIYDKEDGVKMMEFLTKQNGILGVVDECMSAKDYLRWMDAHANEKNSRGQRVPIALESFIPLEQHIRFLDSSEVIARGKGRRYYYFVARKG
ncbi:MAG: hypothetical protein WC861_02405 [Candidatus Micrarchaeia archaeon]|jgi:hypothetical protein